MGGGGGVIIMMEGGIDIQHKISLPAQCLGGTKKLGTRQFLRMCGASEVSATQIFLWLEERPDFVLCNTQSFLLWCA